MLSRRFAVMRVVLPVLALVTMGQVSCSTEETKTEPDEQADQGPSGGGEREQSRPKTAGIGDSLTLEGGSGEKMQVTLMEVRDPAPAGEFDQPQSGQRYVGVQIALKNVGEAQYDDSPSNGAVLLTAQDEQATSTILSGGPCGSQFASSAKIAPGGRQQGCIPFEAPAGAGLAKFQFTLSSGFGPEAGEWNLRGEPGAAGSNGSGGGGTGGDSGTGSGRGGGTSGSTGGGAEAFSGFQDCGGVYANSVTTCGFAQNVKEAYLNSGGSSKVTAHSDATGLDYVMSCTSGSPNICTGGNGAEVRFP
jgi:hypothetical protein